MAIEDYLISLPADERVVHIEWYFKCFQNGSKEPVFKLDEEYSHHSPIKVLKDEIKGKNYLNSHFSEYGFVYEYEIGKDGDVEVFVNENEDSINIRLEKLVEAF